MAEQEVTFQEAVAADAPELLETFQALSSETDFLIMDGQDLKKNVSRLAEALEDSGRSPAKFCLLAKLTTQQIIGVISVSSSSQEQFDHIGDIFVAVRKPYWGQGIGCILMEEAIRWAHQTGIIRRLELTVQKRNSRAIRFYQKCGFEKEGLKKRGVKTKKGEFLDVCLMARLIDSTII